MIEEFKLYGINRGQSGMCATCELSNEDWFHAKIQGTPEHLSSIWNFCENDWNNKKVVKVQHEGYSTGGVPINPIVLELYYAQ